MSGWRLAIYAAPHAGMGGLQFLTLMYFMKYATDELGVAPAAMGLVFGVGRVWDAISDPLVGYLSDITVSRRGRRLPWIIAAVPLVIVASFGLWTPPDGLRDGALAVWTGIAMVLFFSGLTAFNVPHEGLGTELSSDPVERTRIYGARQVAYLIGMAAGIGGVGALVSASDRRRVAAIAVTALAAIALGGALVLMRRLDAPNRVRRQPRATIVDAVMVVWRNPHGRRLLTIQFIERLGTASLSALGAYVAHYLIGDESALPLLLGCFALAAVAFVPIAQRLSRRYGKRRVWMGSMLVSALGFGSIAFAGRGDVAWLCGCAVVAGVGDSAGAVVGSAMLADVIDDDERRHGARREGTFFAMWGLAHKSAYGVALLVTGLALQLAGYVPNQEVQSPQTEWLLRLQMSVLPSVGYLVGLALLRGFLLEPLLASKAEG